MTIQELIDWCKANDVSLDTPIAIRDKDDFLLVESNIRIGDPPYFGNCPNGDDYLASIAPRDEDGDIDYESEDFPDFLILSTGY